MILSDFRAAGGRMDKLTNRILSTVRKEELIPEGAHVTVGFSGGADSVCLLSVLWSVRRLLSCTVEAVHVNHNLRGEEARRDQEFCREFCREREIPFRAVSVDVEALCRKEGLSVEEAARKLRYEALCGEAGSSPDGTESLIAVGHHADDQAETILLNLLRGTGLRGFSGMSARRDNIIRPLLYVRKEEILQYLSRNGLSYVTDSTNLSNDYTRNRIRNCILPELRELNENVSGHLIAAGKAAEEADAYLRKEAAGWISAHEVKISAESAEIPRKILKEEMSILRRYVIIEVLRMLGIPLKDWGETHILSVDSALFGHAGSHVDLPCGVKAENTRNMLVISFEK